MKRLLLYFYVVVIFVACNENAEMREVSIHIPEKIEYVYDSNKVLHIYGIGASETSILIRYSIIYNMSEGRAHSEQRMKFDSFSVIGVHDLDTSALMNIGIRFLPSEYMCDRVIKRMVYYSGWEGVLTIKGDTNQIGVYRCQYKPTK